MRSSQTLWVLPALMLFFLVSERANASVYIPTSGKTVVERLPLKTDADYKRLQELRKRLQSTPNDIQIANELAQAYILEARKDGDPRYFGYAEAAIKPWAELPNPPLAALTIRAILKQSTHQFDSALVDLNRIIQQDRNNGQAILTRATVQQVIGRFAEAKASCARLRGLAADIIVLTCENNVGSLNGALSSSYTSLSKTFKEEKDLDKSLGAWTTSALAEMAYRLGKDNDAEKWFLQSLTLSPGDSYVLGTYADFLIDQGREAEVLKLLNGKIKNDSLLLRLAIASLKLKSENSIQYKETLTQRFDAAAMRNDSVHLREKARFELEVLHKPFQALETANKNWEIQKEPADLRIILRCLVATGNTASATSVLSWIRENRYEDKQIDVLLKKLGSSLV